MTTELPISDLEVSEWDARDKTKNKKNEESLNDLTHSIETDGLLNPITVVKKDSKYLVIAGRRRLDAFKKLGRKTIPVHFTADKTDTEINRAAYMENANREDLNEYEKAYGMLALYESEGYTGKEVLKQLKTLHNQGYIIRETDYNQFKKKIFDSGDSRLYSAIPTEKFIKVCEKIGYTPNTQYQWIQLATQIPKEVLQLAVECGLKREQMTLITHTLLRPHPKLQKLLIKRIAGLPKHLSKQTVYQMLRDIETGAIKQHGEKYLMTDYNRDLINKRLEKDPRKNYLDIMDQISKMFFKLTNRAITRGEFRYTAETLKEGRDHRTSVIKGIGFLELRALEEDLILLSDVSTEMRERVSEEVRLRNKKIELSEK